MEAIWMIIVMIALVFQAISKISGSKGKRPPGWEPIGLPGQGRNQKPEQWEDAGTFPPVLKDWEFPWGETSPKEQSFEDERPEPEKRKEFITRPEPRPMNRAANRQVLKTADNAEYRPEVNLSSGDIVNGLILSELLQPPKCKRKR